MKIIIFGATGQTGLHLVKLALENGHEVTAFVRNNSKINIKNDRLNIVEGSILEKSQVVDAIKNQDAVISCLGGDANNKSTILTDMIKVVVDAMKENNISRIAYIATAGIDNEMPGLLTKMIISLLFKNVINDHKGAAEYIRSNDLDYTLARPLSLTDGDATGSYRATTAGIPKGGKNISRRDLAHFLLDSIENKKHIAQSIGLAY